MTEIRGSFNVLPCLDSDEMAASRRQELDVPSHAAADLGRSAVDAAQEGHYVNQSGYTVDWSSISEAACSAKVSIAPDHPLPTPEPVSFAETRIQVTNETTLLASHRLLERGQKPLALNFANGVNPGGGFLHGAAPRRKFSAGRALYS